MKTKRAAKWNIKEVIGTKVSLMRKQKEMVMALITTAQEITKEANLKDSGRMI
jgi:hypothetical protein